MLASRHFLYPLPLSNLRFPASAFYPIAPASVNESNINININIFRGTLHAYSAIEKAP